MSTINLYLKFQKNIDELAIEVRALLNCNTKNQSSVQMDQERFGLNYGGKYYLFECFGLEIKLLANTGEVLDTDFPEFQYYLVFNEIIPLDSQLFESSVNYMSLFFESNSFEVKIGKMLH
jgi:hypothetical protein